MNQKYPETVRQAIVAQYQEGISASTLAAQNNIPRSTVYAWIKSHQVHSSDSKPLPNMRYIHQLENQVARLEGLLEIIKKADCPLSAPLSQKLDALERLYGEYNVHMLCDALEVSHGTFYNHIRRNKRDTAWFAVRREALRVDIQRVYDDSHQIYGAAKVAAVLQAEGTQVSVKMARELMQDMGLISIRQESKNLYDKEQRKYKNHLKQKFDVDKPNQVWVSDVTYFRYKEHGYYICAVIDLFARRVIAHKIGKSNSTQLVKATFRQAYEDRHPSPGLVFHTDRGTNYRSVSMERYLRECQVTHSFSKAHVPYDNSVMESFFSSMKREELYRTKYRSEKELRAAVNRYMDFYNNERPHAKNQYKTPDAKETEYFNTHNTLPIES